jgi:hypothetical protein
MTLYPDAEGTAEVDHFLIAQIQLSSELVDADF